MAGCAVLCESLRAMVIAGTGGNESSSALFFNRDITSATDFDCSPSPLSRGAALVVARFSSFLHSCHWKGIFVGGHRSSSSRLVRHSHFRVFLFYSRGAVLDIVLPFWWYNDRRGGGERFRGIRFPYFSIRRVLLQLDLPIPSVRVIGGRTSPLVLVSLSSPGCGRNDDLSSTTF